VEVLSRARNLQTFGLGISATVLRTVVAVPALPPTCTRAQVYNSLARASSGGLIVEEITSTWGPPSRVDSLHEAHGRILVYGFGMEGQYTSLEFVNDSLVAVFLVGAPVMLDCRCS